MEARRGLGRHPGSCPPFPPEVRLEKFHEPGIFNYSVLLLSEDKSTLYVGAREAVFALNALNVSEKQHEVRRGRPALPPGAAHCASPGASGPFRAAAPHRSRTPTGRSPGSLLPACVRAACPR